MRKILTIGFFLSMFILPFFIKKILDSSFWNWGIVKVPIIVYLAIFGILGICFYIIGTLYIGIEALKLLCKSIIKHIEVFVFCLGISFLISLLFWASSWESQTASLDGNIRSYLSWLSNSIGWLFLNGPFILLVVIISGVICYNIGYKNGFKGRDRSNIDEFEDL